MPCVSNTRVSFELCAPSLLFFHLGASRHRAHWSRPHLATSRPHGLPDLVALTRCQVRSVRCGNRFRRHQNRHVHRHGSITILSLSLTQMMIHLPLILALSILVLLPVLVLILVGIVIVMAVGELYTIHSISCENFARARLPGTHRHCWPGRSCKCPGSCRPWSY